MRLERWSFALSVGAAALSIVTLVLHLVYMVQHNAELARRDLACAREIARHDVEFEARIGRLNNWLVAIYERGEARGWDLPKPPPPTAEGAPNAPQR